MENVNQKKKKKKGGYSEFLNTYRVQELVKKTQGPKLVSVICPLSSKTNLPPYATALLGIKLHLLLTS